jgi:hypothetical protein
VIFKSSNPQAALDKTRRKLGDVEANIAELKTKRAALLAAADADNIGEVQAVNKRFTCVTTQWLAIGTGRGSRDRTPPAPAPPWNEKRK